MAGPTKSGLRDELLRLVFLPLSIYTYATFWWLPAGTPNVRRKARPGPCNRRDIGGPALYVSEEILLGVLEPNGRGFQELDVTVGIGVRFIHKLRDLYIASFDELLEVATH